jgi:hypothetical protein
VDRQGVAQGDRLHQAAEIVAEEHQIGGFPGHGGAAFAHRHSDVGRLQRRGIVDAIAGYRHHFPRRLQGPHNL